MTSTQRWTLVATIIGSGAVFLDGTIVNVALKRIGEELPATAIGVLEGQTYIVSGYLAVLAALLILAGALSDHYGRRRVYAIGLASFAATSALCGIAPTLETLVLCRLLQGAAGALLVPGSLALINSAFEGDQRGRAFGLWASATSALVLAGPLLGGLLVDTIGWRVAFLVNVPVLAFALWVVRTQLSETRVETTPRRFDWLGSLVAAVAVGGLSAGLIRGQETAWSDPTAWALIGAGTVALIAFPVLMATRPEPLVPLDLFRSRSFSAVNLATFFIYGALYVNLSYQALVFQAVLGYTALGAGALALPVGLLLTLLSARIGTVAGRRGARPFLVGGPLLMAVGFLWWARLPADSAPWRLAVDRPDTWLPPASTLIDVLPGAVIYGLGLACVVAPLTAMVMSSVPARHAGLASAINNAVARIGQPLLGALIFIALTASFYGTLAGLAPGLDTSDPAVRQTFPPLNAPVGPVGAAEVDAARRASIDAYHQAMYGGALLLALGAGVSWFGLRARAAGPSDEAGSLDAAAQPETGPA